MIQAAIVGLGWWGQTLVKSVQGKTDKITFTKGCVRRPDQYGDVAKQLGLELSASYEDLLADPSIEAVVLATPHTLHLSQIEAAAEAGKQIFCEKPLALTGVDAQKAATAAQKAVVILAAGHNRRFHPAFAKMRQMVTDGAFGDVLHVECNMSGPGIWLYQPDSWRQSSEETPAGGLAGMGLHMIDGIISMFGRIERLVAQSSRVHRNEGLDIMTSVLMTMENGMHAYVATALATSWCFDFRVFGEDGWAEMRNNPVDEFTFRPRDGEIETTKFGPDKTVQAELEAFADAIGGKADYPVPVDEVVHGVAVFEAVIESAKTNQWVEIK